MKQILLLGLVGAALFGAGCGNEPAGVPGSSDVPLEQRVAPAAATQPTVSPEIPDAAKNIPRPEMK